jgi:hypothetical protein
MPGESAESRLSVCKLLLKNNAHYPICNSIYLCQVALLVTLHRVGINGNGLSNNLTIYVSSLQY